MHKIKRIGVVGISTEVGKTVVAAILTEALNGRYWKPVQCGPERDCDWVNERLSQKNRCFSSTFDLKTPCSPHWAAKKEGLKIEARDLVPPDCADSLIIEGTGGFLCPLNETENWADAAISWQAQWILVYRPYLGSLNHFFLTIEAMQLRKLPLVGVVFNEPVERETQQMLLKKARTPCLGSLSWQKKITKSTIQKIASQWQTTIRRLI